jgi:hypothetical protein
MQKWVCLMIEIASGLCIQKKYNQYSLHDQRSMGVMDAILKIFEHRSDLTPEEFTAFKAHAFQKLAKLSVPIPVIPTDVEDSVKGDAEKPTSAPMITPQSPSYTPTSPSYNPGSPTYEPMRQVY